LRHQPHLRDHRQQRMQARLESPLGITDGHPRLMAIFVQQPRRIQIQRVTFLAAGQPVQTPAPQRTETAQIGARRIKTLKEPRERRLARHPAHADQIGHHRITTQVSHVGQLARITQQAVHEGQRLFHRQEFIVGKWQGLRQRCRQKLVPAQGAQPTPERGAAACGLNR